MEAAALYAFAKAKDKNVMCFAHLTNTMAQQEGDFEKGDDSGSVEMLDIIGEVLIKLEQSLEWLSSSGSLCLLRIILDANNLKSFRKMIKRGSAH